MKYRLAVLEGADMSEDLLQHLKRTASILPHSVYGMGIRANGDDLSAQTSE